MFKYLWIVILVLIDLYWLFYSLSTIYYECYYAKKHNLIIYDSNIHIAWLWFISHLLILSILSFHSWSIQ